MSIQSEINRISGYRDDSYDAVEDMGGTLPQSATMENLPTAIRSIPQGGGEVYAAISVNYPPGSICTATNGTITLTAADTSGQVVFGIPEPSNVPETWTVNSVDNNTGDSDSSTVSISSYGDNYTIFLIYYDPIFGNNSWNTISAISQHGLGDVYWDIGDKKEIILNGAIGEALTLSNFSTYVFILDFNHSDGGVADNNIILGGFKTSDNVDICLCDSKYGNNHYTSGAIYFNLNHKAGSSSRNPGGWKGCDFRYDILGAVETAPIPYNENKISGTAGSDATTAAITSPKVSTLMSALPNDFRNILRLHTHYVDNTGYISNASANVTSVIDAGIFLLAEYEIFGIRNSANKYEQYKQNQMTYYKNGASKIKYHHNNTTTANRWWTSSAVYDNNYSFCSVSDAGAIMGGANGYASYSRGLAPAFKI